MEATYILLGRPWKFDRKPFHDGHANKFTFSFQGKKITLLPLSPREVNEDQLQMIKKRKEEKAQGHESKKSMITLKGMKKGLRIRGRILSKKGRMMKAWPPP